MFTRLLYVFLGVAIVFGTVNVNCSEALAMSNQSKQQVIENEKNILDITSPTSNEDSDVGIKVNEIISLLK